MVPPFFSTAVWGVLIQGWQYQHTNIAPPQATGGGTRRTIPPPQATGGGPEEPDDTVHPYPLVGGEGGWPTLHHIYIYIYIYIVYIHINHILYPPFGTKKRRTARKPCRHNLMAWERESPSRWPIIYMILYIYIYFVWVYVFYLDLLTPSS